MDDERRAAFVETLGKAIDAMGAMGNGKPEVLAEVMEEALGNEDSAGSNPVVGSNTDPTAGNDVNTAETTDHRKKEYAATEGEVEESEETHGEWKIKLKGYPSGWFYSAHNGKKVLTNAGKLCATRAEALANARNATIEVTK